MDKNFCDLTRSEQEAVIRHWMELNRCLRPVPAPRPEPAPAPPPRRSSLIREGCRGDR